MSLLENKENALDSKLKETYEKLLKIRKRDDLKVRSCKYLNPKFIGFDKVERELRLRYYQIQGIMHLIMMKRFVLGDDCGLGKTICVIGALSFLFERNPNQRVLVLTNKSAVEQWANEFKKFTNGINVIVCKGSPKKREKIREEFINTETPAVMVMGYRTMVQDFSALQNWQWDVFVADECSAFKNPKAQVSKRCAYISQQSDRTWGLSATIIKNNLMEAWGIYQVVCPGLFPSKTTFMEKYCVLRSVRTKKGYYIPTIVGYRKKQIAEFKNVIDPFFLGRSKIEVASDLPTLTTKEVRTSMNKKQKSKYKEALAGLLEVGEKSGEVIEKETDQLTSIIYCQQIADHLDLIDCEGGSSKLEEFIDLLSNGEFCGEKVIVFSKFRKMVDIIENELNKKKVKSVRITGAESEDERKNSQKLFQDFDSGVNIILITMAAAEAVNLQAAKAVVFYDSPWSAGDYIQILGRMIRIGSIHDRVYAVHMVSSNTIDSHVLNVLKKKLDLINQVIGKRIKGEEDSEVIVEGRNEISDLFQTLQEDARRTL